MKEHPIIFSTPMVQAILADRKSMTRRIIKPQPKCIDYTWDDPIGIDAKGRIAIQDDELQCLISCPYGQPDDVLWVRETFAPMVIEDHDGDGHDKYTWLYKVDKDSQDILDMMEDATWKPSIYMPRAAARITLKVIRIRVERLQDITQDDARKEGVYCSESPIGPCYMDYQSNQCNAMTTPYLSFKSLWTNINGSGSWESNPWVWVIEFERLT